MGTVLVMLVLALAAPATAQEAAWAVVFVSTSDSADEAAVGAELVANVTAGLRASGEAIVGQDDLAARVDRDSRPPRPAPRDLVARLERDAAIDAPLMSSLAGVRRNLPQVVAQVGSLLEQATPYVASLGREDSTAELLSRVCLFGVRAELEQGHADEARRRLRECARLTPDLADPNEWRVTPTRWHPPAVVLEHLRLREAIRQSGTEIVVHGTPGTPAECVVRLNGRAMGRTPEARSPVTPGEYAVAVDCGDRPGRVRTVTVEQGATLRVIVPALHDHVVRTTPTLRLAFPDEAALERDAPTALGGFARATGVSRVLAVRDVGNGRTTVRAYVVAPDGTARPSGSVDIDDARSAVALREALRTLTDDPADGAGSDADRAGTPGVVGTGMEGGEVDNDGGGGSSASWLGASVLAIAGAAGLAYAVYAIVGAGDCTQPDPRAPDECARFEETNWTAVGVWGGAGIVALTGAVLWLLLGSSGTEEPGTRRARILDPVLRF